VASVGSGRSEEQPLSFFALFIKQLFGNTGNETPERRRIIERMDYEEAERLEVDLEGIYRALHPALFWLQSGASAKALHKKVKG
jgi:hypothetical protein